MVSPDQPPERPCRFRLTPDCKLIQDEIAGLVAALAAGGAAEDEGRRPRFLLAARRIRQHLSDHVETIESPAGLFDAIGLGAPQLMPQLSTLCEEHAEMDRRLEELDRRLDEGDALVADSPAAAVRVRQSADALGEVLRRHQDSVCRLAQSAGGEGAAGP